MESLQKIKSYKTKKKLQTKELSLKMRETQKGAREPFSATRIFHRAELVWQQKKLHTQDVCRDNLITDNHAK